MSKETLMKAREAATYTGKTVRTIHRLARKGILPASTAPGGIMVFLQSDLDKMMSRQYPEGMTHRDIAQKYGISRTLVIYHFRRLHVKPLGSNRGQRHATVYDEKTVAKFARLLGWDKARDVGQPSQSPINESSDRTGATSTGD